MFLGPVAAMAAPSPSPRLETLLTGPPAPDFLEEPGLMAIQGSFDAQRYVQFLDPQKTQGIESALRSDGFVMGFSRSWVEEASTHILLELVIAFSGREGAKRWLSKSEQADKADSTYKKAIPMAGIDTYYGAHFADPSTALYADVVSFVKGNDYFLVGLVSRADDLGDVAPKQTRKQFDAAPAYTIPPSQWPEAAASLVVGPLVVPRWLALLLGGGGVLIAILLGLGALYLLRRNRSSSPALVAAGPQMSDGRHYWWDGQAWRDAARDVPPEAIRSEDGVYWWDGAAWRLVQQPDEAS
jgi:hypothetical protein